MKNALIAIACLFSISTFGQITNPSPYLSPPPSNSNMWYRGAILNVKLGTLNNNTGLSTTYPQYTYYNNITAPTLIKGQTYTLSVTFDSVRYCSMDITSGCDASVYGGWIDFGRNNIFDVADHVMKDTGGAESIDCTHVIMTRSVTFTVPASAVTGVTRMRVVRIHFNCAIGGGGAHYTVLPSGCASGFPGVEQYGESEDYDVNIQDCPPPSPISGGSSVVVGSTLSLTNSTSGGTWSSDNAPVATVSSSGAVLGVSAGAANISYVTMCGNTSKAITVTDVVNPPVNSVQSCNLDGDIYAYPNPSDGIFTVKGDADVTIIDAFGRKILSSQIRKEGVMDISKYPDGIYFLKTTFKSIMIVKE